MLSLFLNEEINFSALKFSSFSLIIWLLSLIFIVFLYELYSIDFTDSSLFCDLHMLYYLVLQ